MEEETLPPAEDLVAAIVALGEAKLAFQAAQKRLEAIGFTRVVAVDAWIARWEEIMARRIADADSLIVRCAGAYETEKAFERAIQGMD